MANGDLTIAILREIRDEIRETRTDLGERIADVGARIEQTNARLDRLEAEFKEMAAALRDLAAQQLILTRYVGNVVDRHERELTEMRERLARIEARTPGGA